MVAADFRLLTLFVAALLGALALAYLGLRALGYDMRRALTPAEWRMAGKLAATAFFLYVLLLRTLYAGLPAEKFIYGRF